MIRIDTLCGRLAAATTYRLSRFVTDPARESMHEHSDHCSPSRSATMRWAGGVDRRHRLHGQPAHQHAAGFRRGGRRDERKIRAAHRRAKPSAGPSLGTSPQPAPTTPGPTSASPPSGSAATPWNRSSWSQPVAEISADVARDHIVWRHPLRHERLRHDATEADVLPFDETQ